MGFCGIPPALVQRYAEEIQAKLSEVADILEDIRIRSLLESGKVCVRHKMLIFVIFFAFFYDLCELGRSGCKRLQHFVLIRFM